MNKHTKQWLKIAEAYLTPFEERKKRQQTITKCGLCWAARDIFPTLKAYQFFHKMMPKCKRSHWWPRCMPESDKMRAVLALFLAAMPAEIYKDFEEEQ